MGYITLLINHHWVLAPHKNAFASTSFTEFPVHDKGTDAHDSPANILASPVKLSNLVAKLNETDKKPSDRLLKKATSLILHIRSILTLKTQCPSYTYNARLALLYLVRINDPTIHFPSLYFLFHSLDSFTLTSDELTNLLCLLEALSPYMPPVSHSLNQDRMNASIAIQV
jgi:hypothetical protein